MANEKLKSEIKKLKGLMEENTLLDYELSGYMKDSQRRALFRQQAKHKAIPKKKYTYIDQGGSEVGSQSGRLLVQMKGADTGYVWGIKAYGQRGRPVGQIKDVITDYEKANQSLKQAVMKRALKNRLKRT